MKHKLPIMPLMLVFGGLSSCAVCDEVMMLDIHHKKIVRLADQKPETQAARIASRMLAAAAKTGSN